MLRDVFRWILGGVLLLAGVGHFVQLNQFMAQVPPWMPAPEAIVIVSGIIEMGLGAALLLVSRYRTQVGWIVAAFFIVIFPGNISQLITQTDAFGLDSDLARTVRLLFQPVLVVWALWCTGAWRAWRDRAEPPGTPAPAKPGGSRLTTADEP